MKKILITLDYNPTAQKVAETGFALSKAMGAQVTLLHVITDPVYYSTLEYSPIMGTTGNLDMQRIQFDSDDGLQKASQFFLDKTKHHLGDDTVETIVIEGDYAECILKAAKEMDASFIVMGSHSHRWLESILMGSVTEKVLRLTSIPLFIVPTKK